MVEIFQERDRDRAPSIVARGKKEEGEDDVLVEGRVSLRRNPVNFREKMRRIGFKIKDRVQAIVDEYDEKIRDCTMRVDGMAMATQWVSTCCLPHTPEHPFTVRTI